MRETEHALQDHEDCCEESEEKQNEKPIKQYEEILYSKDEKEKKQILQNPAKTIHRDTWENTSTIEKKIDTIQTQDTKTSSYIADIEEKVDRVLAKKRKI
ncbi:MAG: hypothetical protein QXL17_02135 [Candidatus Thermoplasmatota archaeon]